MARYVKFMRGTPKAFEALAKKDEDTLYFIHEKDALDGCLYLGSKMIAGEGNLGESSIDALADVLLSESIDANSILVYDDELKQWINKGIYDIFQSFVGATSESSGVSGLVPAPEKGQTKLFLRSDGVWAIPPSGSAGEGYITSVSDSFSVSEDGELQLKSIPVSSVEGLEDLLKQRTTWGSF